MSRERCISLDNKHGVYIPERSPNRTLNHTTADRVQHAINTPNLYSRHCGGANGNRSIICFPINNDNVQGNPEYLDDYEEPSFYDPPPHSSFDEVICIMATPPKATQRTDRIAAEKLDEARTEVTDVVNLEDLRRRMAAHIETSEDQHGLSVQVDDVRQRLTAALVQGKDPPKIPPLPEDPYDIPPPPKDPKDVVATIRRARAIARLKALEEKNAPTNPDKKKSLKQVPIIPKSKSTITKQLPKKALPQKTGVAKTKTKIPRAQHPPDYVPAEWAAAILRTRTLAGLKTINPKLLPKEPEPPAAKPKSPLRGPPPPSPTPLQTPTFENIMERMAAIRSRTHIAETDLAKEEQTISTPTLQDELDEFEVLEELYGAEKPEQYPETQRNGIDLQSRISALKRQLFESAPTTESVSEENLDQDELDEFEALEEQYGARNPGQYPPTQQTVTDLQQRINALKHKLLQTPPPVEPLSEEKHDVSPPRAEARSSAVTPKSTTPQRYRSPDAVAQKLNDAFLESLDVPEFNINDISEVLQDASSEIVDEVSHKASASQRPPAPAATPQTRLPKFDDAFLENIDMPEFDIGDVPEFAFSAEALKDAGFEIEDAVSLGDISMPDFNADISLDELGLEDISAPVLFEMSTSNVSMVVESEYPSEVLTEEHAEQVVEMYASDGMPGDPGLLTSIVNGVVERLRNIFSPSADEQNVVEEDGSYLDTSLPSIFKDTPPKVPVITSPHAEDQKDNEGIVQRDQEIPEKTGKAADLAKDHKMGKIDIKSSMPKRTKIIKSKGAIPKKKKKIYPPGEYSPTDVKAVSRARSLAGLKNLSALLNPERAARIAERKARREAEEAAIEALPPVERMREKMKKMRQTMGGLPRPSIEALATLEAIRDNLPKRRPPKRQWRPAGRLRVDRRVHPSERVFKHDFGHVFAPPKKQRKLGWRPIVVMSPIAEQTQFEDEDIIKFSPLRPHEGRMRLDYLKEQAAKQTAELIRDAAQRQAALSHEASPRTPGSSPRQFSPIQIQSPTSPRTEESRREKIITQIGPHGGQETVREEVTEISTIENGEVHTSTRQVTTKTDEYGNVTRHVQKGKGFSGEEETKREDLADIEPPDFLDTSDIPPPLDTSIPSPAEIINRIRSNVKQRLSLALPNIPESQKSSPSPASPVKIDFPQDLTDEELFDVETPEFERTPHKASPQAQQFSPVERDQRMYAWGELPPENIPQRIQTPKYSPRDPVSAELLIHSPTKKSPEDLIRIPPHPKDPKDYKAMIKRAQAIEKLKNQELAAKAAARKQTPSRPKRVPISRRQPSKQPVLKKRFPKISPKKTGDQGVHEDMEIPSEPPALPKAYIKAVARARLIRGLANRTAALNPEVAAKQAAQEAAQAAFDALPDLEKIRRRMQILRGKPTKKRRAEPSADVLGTLAAIRANMPPIEDVLRQPSTQRSPIALSPKTPPTKYQAVKIPQAPVRARSRVTDSIADMSLEEFELMERYLGAMPVSPLESLEVGIKPDTSLDEFEALEAEAQKLYDYDTPKRIERHKPRRLITPPTRRSPLPARGTSQQPPISRSDVESASLYYELMEDFRIPAENVMETSQLMAKTPPRNIQERLQRLKEAQSARKMPSEDAEQFYEIPGTPAADFSPIRLISPTVAGEPDQPDAISAREENELLLNIDETPDRKVHKIKQLRDLEDMPFDQIEYEIEPALADISFEKPLTPPPRPSDIIRRIRSAYQQQLREFARSPAPKSPEMLKLPEGLPEEELLEQSSPSFTQTPRTPPLTSQSPQASLPSTLGEVLPVTSVTPTPQKPTPIKELAPRSMRRSDKDEISVPEGPIVIPPHPKDSKDYAAMIKRARAIYKLNKQKEAEEADKAPPSKIAKKERVPISRWQGPPPKRTIAKQRKKIVLKKRVQKPVDTGKKSDIKSSSLQEETEYKEPPPLSQEYRDAVARARRLRGLINRTAALNPKIAAKQIAREAAIAAFNALPEIEKIKLRMERLRRDPRRRRRIKPTMEQIAYLEAMKQIGEFEDSELVDEPPVIHAAKDYALKQRSAGEELPQIEDELLAEFEALEALLEAAPVQQPTQTVASLNISKIVSDMRQQLVTPPRVDPRERYRRLMAQRKTPTVPVVSPVKTPEIRYSSITLPSSPSRAEKSTTQTTRSGNDTIKEQVTETSEIMNGKLEHFKTLVTTTTDPQGNITSQIKESKRVSARDRSAEFAENLEHIEEPSFLDTTPLTPVEQPRPRDIIERIARKLKESYRPEVPTGHLIELRTPPQVLPLPTEISEEELTDLSFPELEKTPPPSLVRSLTRSPPKSLDISIPEVFAATPPPPTPPLPPVSPLRYRIPSPEGPIVIPRHPKDPTDYKTMLRRARKIQQLIKQKEAEALAAKENEDAAERAKAGKKERVPISKWSAPPPRKPGKRRKLVLKKRDEVLTAKVLPKQSKLEEGIEPLALPEQFAKEIARARKLAGLKTRTAALNPKVAAREAAIAKAIEDEAARAAAIKVPQRSPVKDYDAVLSRMREMRQRGAVVHSQPSLAAAAYLDALKAAMQVREHPQHATESPRTRYDRILAARTALPSPVPEIPIGTPVHGEIHYTPIRLTSPHIAESQMGVPAPIAAYVFDTAAFEDLDELEALSEFEQPSYVDVSQHPVHEQHMPLTPPTTPPHVSSAVVSRIRQQYEQQRSASPEALEFPENLPEEELLELSAPSFAQSPIISETPIKSPNISIPHYFEESPITMPSTEAMITDDVSTTSPPLLGVIPGIKVTTPQGHIRIPDHPKDPTDVVAMIRRAQLIKKIKAKEVADKASVAKVRVPISRRVPRKDASKKGRLIDKTAGPPKLSNEYLAQVVRSRKLAAQTPKAAPRSDTKAMTTQASPSYLSLMERYAALRAVKQKTQQVPTARELTHRQHLINRQQRRERRRLLHELERQRQQQDIELEPTRTPPTARERLIAIKSRIPVEAPISSAYPYSPVKTPEIIDVPQYQPISLARTPPYQFLENVHIPEIEDISMPLDDLANYTLGFDTADEEDIEFQLAEIQNASYAAFNDNVSIAEIERAEQDNFDISERIKMLQQQLLQSPDKDIATELKEYNMIERMQLLKNQLLQTSTQQEASLSESMTVLPNFDEDDEQYDQQDIFNDLMADFEALEREYL